MGIVSTRAGYRVRQFRQAVESYLIPPGPAEIAEVRHILPPAACGMFESMPRPDQRHALNVLQSLRAAGYNDATLLQAALLHDVAKHQGGVTLIHRVAAVLLKKFVPVLWMRWTRTGRPPSRSLRYPLWVLANHPALSAKQAAGAGCLPGAVALIRDHQAQQAELKDGQDILLGALRAADDDN